MNVFTKLLTSTYYISAVRLSTGTLPFPHHHIEAVRLTTGVEVTRQTVATGIRAGMTYMTAPPVPVASALVYVERACPWCGAQDYITTVRDHTKLNNLLHLPTF